MIKYIKERKFLILKWLFVVLSLLFIPKSAVAIIALFIFFYLFNKIDNFDIVLVFFLIFFIQNSLESLGDLDVLRFLFIPLIILNFFLTLQYKKKPNIKAFKVLLLFLSYLLINVLLISINFNYSLIEFGIFIIMMFFCYTGTETCGASPHFVVNNYNGFRVKDNSIQDLKDKLECIIDMDPLELLEYGKKSRELSQNITPEIQMASLLQLLYANKKK